MTVMVNSAPNMVWEVIRKTRIKDDIKKSACWTFCFPFRFISTIFNDQRQLEKLDRRNIKQIKTKLKEIKVSKKQIMTLSEEDKKKEIRKQIDTVKEISGQFDKFHSKMYKNRYCKANPKVTKYVKKLEESLDPDKGKAKEVVLTSNKEVELIETKGKEKDVVLTVAIDKEVVSTEEKTC